MSKLSVSIRAEFGSGSLLGGQIKQALGCQLSISQGHYLMQADLVQPTSSHGLDVVEVLNNAFDCALSTGYILVDQAGFFTFGRLQAEQPARALANIFPATTLPAEIAAHAMPADNTTALWLVLNLRSSGILEHLIEIGKDGHYSQLALYAQLDNKIDMQANLRTLTLCARLSSIKLLNLFDFRNIEFRLRINSEESKSFALAGDIDFRLFDQQYLLNGCINADSHGICTRIATDKPIKNLFAGKMPGVSFEYFDFQLYHTFSTANTPGATLILLTGTVSFAGLTIQGELHLTGAKPVFALLRLDKALSISAFVQAVIPAAGAWPTDMFDLRFEASSKVYYQQPKADLPHVLRGAGYQDGFNAAANVCLTLLTQIKFALVVQVLHDSVTARVSLERPINLFIIQLTGINGRGGPDVVLNISSKHKALKFTGEVQFFGQSCGELTISCGKNTANHLKVSGNIAITDPSFNNLIPVSDTSDTKLTFAYDADTGFSLTGWPDFDFISSRIDFATQLIKWAQTGRRNLCGKLPELINKQLLTTKFKLAPSFAQDNNGDTLRMSLNGACTLSVSGTQVVQFNLPDIITFPLQKELRWGDLPDAIGTALKDAEFSLFAAIEQDKEALAQLIFALAGKKAAEFGAVLLCRNLISQSVSNALRLAANALADQYGGVLASALGGGILALIAEHINNNPRPPSKPNALTAKAHFNATDQTGILFSWAAAAPVTKYTAYLYDDKKTCIYQQQTNDSTCQVFFPLPIVQIAPPKRYFLQVVAVNNGQHSQSDDHEFIFTYTLDEIIERAFIEKRPGAACGARVRSAMQQVDTSAIALSMAKIGYSPEETLAGLKAAKPDIELNEIAAAIIAAYGLDSTAQYNNLNASTITARKPS